MVVFSALPPQGSGDIPPGARARLATLNDTAAVDGAPDTGLDSGGGPASGAEPDLHAEPDPDSELGRVGTSRVPTRAGRLVRRWVPGPLVAARWEPGRPGALVLSLVAAAAAVLAAVGVWRERPVPVPVPPLPVVTAVQQGPADAAPAATTTLVISVVGRVARPGLVELPDGSRVADALDAAGGVLPDTDVLALNLARRLSDGEQLLVGVEPPPGYQPDGGVTGPSGPSEASSQPPLDLNTATLEQLDALPGVGPVTAQRILDWRAAHGRFRSVDQLREVSGIGPARFRQLKDLVRT